MILAAIRKVKAEPIGPSRLTVLILMAGHMAGRVALLLYGFALHTL